MPTILPIPPAGVIIANGNLPVGTIADVAAVWSPDLEQDIPTAPVRDAIQAGELAAFYAYQAISAYAAEQSDLLRATAEYLDECAGELGFYRATGDTDTTYRARAALPQTTVDPNDIIAVANGVLAAFTAISCRYAERVDCAFASNPATTSWSSHVFNLTDGGAGATPNYPDRLYARIQNRRPSGAMVSGDAYGRSFFLRVPDVTAIDNTVAALYQLGNPNPPEQPVGGGGFWLGNPSDGVTAQNVTYLEHVNATSLGLYQAVVDAVNAIIGTGIRWTMIADPNLTA